MDDDIHKIREYHSEKGWYFFICLIIIIFYDNISVKTNESGKRYENRYRYRQCDF